MAFITKDWLFTITKTALRRGTRLKNGDKPTEQTFFNWVQSSVFKTEAGDRASENDPGKPLEEVNGHVALATDTDVKTNAAQPSDRSLAVQPSQMTTAQDDPNNQLTVSFDTINPNDTVGTPVAYDDKPLEVEDVGTSRNDYYIGWRDNFLTWFASFVNEFNNISSKLVSTIQQVKTNTQDITTLKEVDGDVSAVIDGVPPAGTIIKSVLNTGMNPAFWTIMDGTTPLSKWIGDDVINGPTPEWTLFEGLGIVVESGDFFGFQALGDAIFDDGITAGSTQTSANDWKATLRDVDIPRHGHTFDLETDVDGGHRHKYGTIWGGNDGNLTDPFAANADRAFSSVPDRDKYSWWTDDANYSDEVFPITPPSDPTAIGPNGNRGYHKHNVTGTINNFGTSSVTYPEVNVPKVGVYYYIKVK